MKQLITKSLILVIFSGIYSVTIAQEKGNKNLTLEERQLKPFSGLDIGGSVNVFIEIADEQSIKIETDENLQDKVITTVSNEVLTIKSNNIKNPIKLNSFIKLPS